MKVALIATGNEVVSGQILNRNASHFAQELSRIGIEVCMHFAVLDRKEDLQSVLQFIEKEKTVDLAVTIGGLGPTRDDLTRWVVSQYCGRELEFDAKLWESLEQELHKRKVTPREGHRYQCEFPKGAQIFKNPVGTAQAFMAETQSGLLQVLSLPGPPKELFAIYEKGGLKEWFLQRSRPQAQLYTWQCIHIPESELAHQLEAKIPESLCELGFRATPPITEVKLWVPESLDEDQKQKLFKVIEEETKPYLYSQNEFSYLKNTIDFLLQKDQALFIEDLVSRGELFSEILALYSTWPKNVYYSMMPEKSEPSALDLQSKKDALILRLEGESVLSKTYQARLALKKAEVELQVEHSLDLSVLVRKSRKNKALILELFKKLYESLGARE